METFRAVLDVTIHGMTVIGAVFFGLLGMLSSLRWMIDYLK